MNLKTATQQKRMRFRTEAPLSNGYKSCNKIALVYILKPRAAHRSCTFGVFVFVVVVVTVISIEQRIRYTP